MTTNAPCHSNTPKQLFVSLLVTQVACYAAPRPPAGADADTTSTSDATGSTSTAGVETGDTTSSPPADTTSVGTSTTVDETSSGASTEDGSSSSTGGEVNCLGPTLAEDIVFAEPVPLPGANTAVSEEDGWLSPDERTLWVTTVRPEGVGGYDIWRATRDDIDEPFGAAVVVPVINSTSNDERATLSGDALTMFFASNRPGGVGSFDIMVAVRDNALVDFGPAAPLANVNSAVSESAPAVTADGSEIYFASDRSGAADIYRATAGVGGAFDAAVAVAEINDPDAADGSPVPSPDGLALYFASERDGVSDVYVATRSTRDDGFGEPVALAGIASPALEWPVSISGDGCRLVIGSNRPGEGGYDLWVATRSN